MPPSMPQIIHHIWLYIFAMINAGRINNIVLPLTMKAVIGQHGLDLIVSRFTNMILAPVDAIEEAINGVIRIRPRSNLHGRTSILDAQAPKSKFIKSPGKVSRPANAFILYRKANHPLIVNANPGMHNNQISVILGAQWRNEPVEVKNQYITQANVLKAQHAKDHPEYTYQPRKTGDKKRRMTNKKAAALADITGGFTAPTQATASGQTNITSTAPVATTTAPVVATSNLGNGEVQSYSLDAAGFDLVDDNTLPALPELATTDTGNPMFTLGDFDISDEQLFAMLEVYNQSMPTQSPADAFPAVIYAERSDEAQDQYNFFNSVIDYDGVLENDQQTIQSMQALLNANSHP